MEREHWPDMNVWVGRPWFLDLQQGLCDPNLIISTLIGFLNPFDHPHPGFLLQVILVSVYMASKDIPMDVSSHPDNTVESHSSISQQDKLSRCLCLSIYIHTHTYTNTHAHKYMVPPPQLSTVFVGSLEPTRENPPYFRV